MKKVYIGELDRFGYTLTVVGATKKTVKEKLSEAYLKAYKDINGTDPREEENDRWGGSYYKNAMSDIVIRELEFGEVEWM